MIVFLAILIIMLISVIFICGMLYIYSQLFADPDWIEYGEEEDELDNSEYDYGHDVHYENKADNFLN